MGEKVCYILYFSNFAPGDDQNENFTKYTFNKLLPVSTESY